MGYLQDTEFSFNTYQIQLNHLADKIIVIFVQINSCIQGTFFPNDLLILFQETYDIRVDFEANMELAIKSIIQWKT